MQTYDTKIGQEFSRLVEREMDARMSAIAAGALTFEEYKYRSGNLAGLRDALELYDEAIKVVLGGQ